MPLSEFPLNQIEDDLVLHFMNRVALLKYQVEQIVKQFQIQFNVQCDKHLLQVAQIYKSFLFIILQLEGVLQRVLASAKHLLDLFIIGLHDECIVVYLVMSNQFLQLLYDHFLLQILVLVLLLNIGSNQLSFLFFQSVYFKDVNKLLRVHFLFGDIRLEEILLELIAIEAFDLQP